MKPTLVRSASDRGARVNEVLGRALGVSSQGLLRSGRQIEDYTAPEWSALLRTVTAGYAGRIDPRTGTLLGSAPEVDGAPGRPPAVAERLAALGYLRRRLEPSLASLSSRRAFEISSADEVTALISQIGIAFADLEQAVASEFGATEVIRYARRLAAPPVGGRDTGLLWDLRAVVLEGATDTIDEESIAYALSAAATELVALQDRIRSESGSTPLFSTREVVADCRQGLEEAHGSLEDICDELGLLPGDLGAVMLRAQPALSLADGLAALRQDCASIVRLLGVGGARQIRDAGQVVLDTADRLAPVARLTRDELCRRLTLSDDEADELLPRLKRLAGRAKAGADQLRALDPWRGAAAGGLLTSAPPRTTPAATPAQPAPQGSAQPLRFTDFAPRDGARPNVPQSSEWQTVRVPGPMRIAVIGPGAEYKIKGQGSWTAATGLVASDANIRVRVRAAAQAGRSAEARLSIGSATRVFRVTTRRSPPIDGDFTQRKDVPPYDEVSSEPKVIGGGRRVRVSIQRGDAEFRLRRGTTLLRDWGAAPTWAEDGDEVEVRMESGGPGRVKTTCLSVGDVSVNFEVTSRLDSGQVIVGTVATVEDDGRQAVPDGETKDLG